MHFKKKKKENSKIYNLHKHNFNKTIEQIIPKRFFQQDFASIYKCVVFEINIVKGISEWSENQKS